MTRLQRWTDDALDKIARLVELHDGQLRNPPARRAMRKTIIDGDTSWIRFTLAADLALTDASQAGCTVDDYWGGSDPGANVTVYNLPASSDYIFQGDSGGKGLAVWDDVDEKYWITQLECPA